MLQKHGITKIFLLYSNALTIQMKSTLYRLICCVLFVSVSSCVEEIAFSTTHNKRALVIESTLTNEIRFQEVRLSHSYALNQAGPSYETNAIVSISDDQQQTYTFHSLDSGRYVSDVQFAAVPGRLYQLEIQTADGQQYSSTPTALTSETQIDALNVAMESIEGKDYFVIKLDSYDPTGQSKYYRYAYEETYKIVAPYYSDYKTIVIQNESPYKVDTVPKTTASTKICYATQRSQEIIQTETTALTEDRLHQFPVHRLPVDDFKVSHRYSILVKQFVQSPEAYAYFNTLNEFSEDENLFSQIQTGFITGNISAEDPEATVIGFFEVAAVNSKRLFFNYRDFINTGRPPYKNECSPQAPELETDKGNEVGSPLIDQLNSGEYMFYMANHARSEFFPGPYLIVNRACGDCTVFGSVEKPDFWVDI